MTELVGRLAPSPTGRLHVGHARSFLLAWWSVRSRGGRVVLRIEDLDAERTRPDAVDAVLADLEWLGLDWDGPVAMQSEEVPALEAAAEELADRGLAFPCVCTRREVALSAPHASDGEVRYPGTCRGRFPDVARAEAATGRAAALRFRCDPGPVAWSDSLLGPQSHDPGAEVGDFTIRRRDGAIGYQLAAVVSDARAGVTEVLRGRDLASSSPRQLLLQRALGLEPPTWVHVPLVVGDDGERLAKRAGSLALEALRADGVDPRALIAWIARGAGLAAPEPATAAELAPAFDLARLPSGDVRFGAAERAGLLAT